MKHKILIIGGGGQARVTIDLIRALGDDNFEIEGILDDHITGHVLDVPVLGRIDEAGVLAGRSTAAHVAIGDNVLRRRIVKHLDDAGWQLPFVTLIHPSAVVASGVHVGEGTLIAAEACIMTSSTIGRHCIVNTNASLDHDNTLADFASVAPGVVTGGDVFIGEQSFLSIGSVVKHNITIKHNVLIGAGSLVLHDIHENSLCYGSPARVVQTRREDEPMM